MLNLNLTDITANLSSVQFESALNDEQREENKLRNKSHCLLYFACSQALYYTAALNEFRENRLLVLHPNDKKLSNKLLKDLQAKEPMLVGIIGYGRLGSRLANLLIGGSGLMPQEVKISTRKPEAASQLAKLGTICTFDNARVASSVHALFLCCPPAAVPQVAAEIRDHISPRTVVCSFVSGYNERKLRQLFDHESLICPFYHCDLQLSSSWDLVHDMVELMAKPETCAAACPVQVNPDQQQFVTTSTKLATLWAYSIANMCTHKGHTIDETVKILNHIFIRSAIKQKKIDDDQEEEDTVEQLEEIRTEDLIRGLEETDTKLPIFDLTEIALQDTFLDQRLLSDSSLAADFCSRFVQRLGAACTKLKFHES